MFNLISEDHHDEYLDKRIKELVIENDALNLKVAKLMEELELKPQQLTQFLATKENFTEKNWDEIQEIQKQQSEKLLKDLAQIGKRRKNKSKKSDAPKPYWVMMR